MQRFKKKRQNVRITVPKFLQYLFKYKNSDLWFCSNFITIILSILTKYNSFYNCCTVGYHCRHCETDVVAPLAGSDQFMSLLGSISPRLEGQRPNSRGHATQSQWSGPTSCEPISISAPASLWQTSKHRHCQWSGDSDYLWPPLTSNPIKAAGLSI